MCMKVRSILVMMFVMLSACGFTQEREIRPNSMFLEIAGIGGYTINYERSIIVNNWINFSSSIGVGTGKYLVGPPVIIPVQVKSNFVCNSISVEFGFSYAHWVLKKTELDPMNGPGYLHDNIGVGYLGYRQYLFRKRAFLSIAYTPKLFGELESPNLSSISLRLGFTF